MPEICCMNCEPMPSSTRWKNLCSPMVKHVPHPAASRRSSSTAATISPSCASTLAVRALASGVPSRRKRTSRAAGMSPCATSQRGDSGRKTTRVTVISAKAT